MASMKMVKMIFSSFFGKRATTSYPFKPRTYYERTRGQIAIRENDCILCGICAKKCPCDAITVDRGERVWKIERMQCIQCSSCVDSCPKKCLDNLNLYTTPNTTKIVDVVNVPEQVKKDSAPTANEDAVANQS